MIDSFTISGQQPMQYPPTKLGTEVGGGGAEKKKEKRGVGGGIVRNEHVVYNTIQT